ncbi:MAG: DinB family protein [Chloroflexota bacterium]
MAAVNPVTQPNDYQRLILGYLGDDDPYQVQSGTPALMRAVIGDAADDLRARPAEGEWSVVELIGHMTDAEIVMTNRYRLVLAQDTPPIVGYDQDLWAQRLRHRDADSAALLSIHGPLRTANLALWKRTPVEDRARAGIHSERGPESYELMFRLTAGHDRFHLEQARRTLEQVRGR